MRNACGKSVRGGIIDRRSEITGGPTAPLFRTKVLGKYDVTYYVCCETGYIQTETPYWLEEAYSAAITALDVGLVSRNVDKVSLASRLIDRAFCEGVRFIDYGGGYGIFTRLMRDKGYEFVHYDTHCENLFAKRFQVSKLSNPLEQPYDLLTAWEVFEHLPSPRESLDEMLNVSDAVLFSTELIPNEQIRKATDWWYFTPETGQHVGFFTAKAIQFLANDLSLHFYSDGRCNHILSKAALTDDPFAATKRHSFGERCLRRLVPQPWIDLTLRRLLPSHIADSYLRHLYPRRPVARPSLLESDFQDALTALRSIHR